jgi:hypothetical protein
MTTTRKRSSGFNTTPESETLELSEEIKEVLQGEPTEVLAPEPAPFVEETIVPMEDFASRFTEEPEAPPPQPKKAPELQPGLKRHPRNVPKFSRTR